LVYHAGQYGSSADFAKLNAIIEKDEPGKQGDRIFYLAIPPSVFAEVAKAVSESCMAKTGWTRVVVEKPFGKDLESSRVLSQELALRFEEDQIFRIDHYLGKELVQNTLALRFANLVFESIWNRHFISVIVITFKEDIGTEGRGGYFNEFGIIRDVMQNHLMQVLSLVGMEPPLSLTAEDIRDEKVKVSRHIPPITIEDLVVGQYTKDPQGKYEGYLDDPQVPKDSITPTFATAVLHIHNARWNGVPFILKCGKGLNERKAEIRIQFKKNPAELYPSSPPNELVVRIQPNEAMYLKFSSKVPGLSEDIAQTELDLTYKQRFEARLPDAYERLIYDVIRGDHNLFVRVDELDAAWKIFSPILHKLEKEKIKPIPYPFGSRGPVESDQLMQKYGFIRSPDYSWPQTKL